MPDLAESLDERAAAAEFVARLGSAMLGADYPVNVVRRALVRLTKQYGLSSAVLVFPNFVQVNDGGQIAVHSRDRPLRYDQTFPLGELVARAESGRITAIDGLAALDRIHQQPTRFRTSVRVLGCGVQSAGYSLILQPTPVALIAAAGLGVVVGALEAAVGRNGGLRELLPVLSAFLVAIVAFGLGRALHFGHDSLRVVIPPLVHLLPGVAITLAVIESSTGQMVSGAARLTAGLLKLAQLALGITIAIQLLDVSGAELTNTPVNSFGAWAPWLGVAVYAAGIAFYLGPPRAFVPWLVLVLFLTHGAQVATAGVFSGYVSGFGGGLVLMICALALGRLSMTPATQVVLAPGFWLLVPSSVGLIGIAEVAEGGGGGAVAAMFVSIMSIALGFQVGMAIWSSFPHRGGWAETDD